MLKTHYDGTNIRPSIKKQLCGRFMPSNEALVTDDLSKVTCGLCIRLVNGYSQVSTHPPLSISKD